MEKIEAVNTVLNAIGEAPINSLEDTSNVDVSIILEMIKRNIRDVLLDGYDFNTIDSLILYPDTRDNRIVYPNNLFNIKDNGGGNITKRGDYFYDMDNRTFEFSKAIDISAVEILEFEDLPHPFKAYVTALTAKEYQERYLGDAIMSQALAEKLMYAKIPVMDYMIRRGQLNMFNNPAVVTLKGR